MFKRVLFVLLLVTAISPARATDYTDIWWNPAESGWGVNLAQNGSFIFATFFIYGSDSKPTWYTGQLTQDPAGKFTGPLYATTGPWFGTVPFDPAQVGITQVGAATFQPTAADAGVLTYNVAATQVAKNVKRQTLAPIPMAGNYIGGITVVDSNCTNPSDNGPASAPSNLLVTQTGGQVEVTLDFFGLASCVLAGTAAQVGRLWNFPATFTCGEGTKAAATVYELRVTSLGIEGRWTTPNIDGCHEEGTFGAVRSVGNAVTF
jgi:hypothetical protein